MLYHPLVVDSLWGPGLFTARDMRYAIRVAGRSPRNLLSDVQDAVWRVNPNLPVSEVLTLDAILANSMAQTSFTLVTLSVAAGVALLLGIVGVYGVLSYLVAQRTREMGVRLALGARPSDVRRMVVRQGARLGAAGAVVGLAAAVGLTKLMTVLLFGVSAIDPVTYGLVTVALIGAVLLASYLPARRAAAVDPTDALRWE
jgi:ABC-type antimicrobial peptide transport system permease subunit